MSHLDPMRYDNFKDLNWVQDNYVPAGGASLVENDRLGTVDAELFMTPHRFENATVLVAFEGRKYCGRICR